MTGGDSSLKHTAGEGHSVLRLLLTATVIFLLVAGITALVIWLVFRPSKPHFTVVGAAIYDLNTTSTTAISTNVQFTVVCHNPNRRVAIYYDHLTAYVSYRSQAITPPISLPPLFQGHKVTVGMSPMLGGGLVPVSPEVGYGLAADQGYGVVGLRWVLLGRLKYKAGAIWSRRYGIYVRCDVLVGIRKGFVGQVPLLGSPDCSVDV